MNWVELQEKWQLKWQKAELGKATRDENKEKFMMIFAYPGISGFMHVGHMRGFSYTDAICRLERMKGKEVFFPVGTHASGNHAFAFANKVKKQDAKWINYLTSNGCPESKLKDLEDPKKMIEYFNEVYVEDYWKKFGFLADWSSFTSTTNKDYEKFIQWQFRTLFKKDLLIQKPYFATACVVHGPVAVDPSETDISQGGNAEKNEYTLLKFKFRDNAGDVDYLVAATLRPETIYGQTNLWINPGAQYVRVEVEKEHWIMSRTAAQKLSYQIDDVIIKEDVPVKDMLGKTAIAPGIEREIPIFPALFVDEKVGSGVVTCVPSDAPYDYIALSTLQASPELREKYKLDLEQLTEVKLIPIIQTKGYGEYPAKEECIKLGIKDLDDTKLEEATKNVYKAGFHSGVMRDICGKFAGMRVADAKEAMKLELLTSKQAGIFHDLSEEVICRCGEKVIIKRIDDQWFIRYSDSEITEKSKDHVAEMNIYPSEYKEQLPAILDWFQERACVRLGKWMGSKFPLDNKWTVEPISDSTLYPSYYIVSRYVNDGRLSCKELNDDFFNYVFLGKEPSEKTDNFATWKEVKKDFNYFYPLDINLGGKEHKTVHFPVFLMNHVAILDHSKWPKGIFVNWWVTGKGGKISKSKGGAEPIPEAMSKYGVDAMRFYYAHIGSPHVDVVWTEETVLHYKNGLEKCVALIEEISLVTDNKQSAIDVWLESEFYKSVNKINTALEGYNLRELSAETYFGIFDHFRWYLRRGGSSSTLLKLLTKEWIKLMCPITPHLAEELAEKFELREGDFVSTSTWPIASEDEINLKAEASEEMIRTTMKGMRKVLELAKIDKPKKYTLFVAERWLYSFVETVKGELGHTRNLGEIIRKVMENPDFKEKGKQLSKMISAFIKDQSKLPKIVLDQDTELTTMRDAVAFLEKEFGCEVEVLIAEVSDEAKAKLAMPGKVGILVE